MRYLATATLPLIIALLAAPLAAQRDDHPLLTRYTGSEVASKNVEDFGEYMLATGMDREGKLTGRKVEGKVTRFVYSNPAGRSTLEIYRNYENALTSAGIQRIWSCAESTCGPAFARSAWNRFNGLFAAADGDPRYLAGSVRGAGGEALVAVMVGRQRTQVDIVELKPMEGGMVVANADALAGALDRDGRVVVNGIFFDTDRAIVKPESKPALDEVARLLGARPTLRLFVVGHTDITGDLAHNRQLSEARARAVAAALVKDYGIAATRLDAYGVGPLSPSSTNASDAGRALNRRVELVAR